MNIIGTLVYYTGGICFHSNNDALTIENKKIKKIIYLSWNID